MAFDSSPFAGMVNFLQLTMLQLGGEVKLMEKGGVEVGHNRYFETNKLFSLSGQTSCDSQQIV